MDGNLDQASIDEQIAQRLAQGCRVDFGAAAPHLAGRYPLEDGFIDGLDGAAGMAAIIVTDADGQRHTLDPADMLRLGAALVGYRWAVRLAARQIAQGTKGAAWPAEPVIAG